MQHVLLHGDLQQESLSFLMTPRSVGTRNGRIPSSHTVIALETNAALPYKLRMMGVPREGASNTFGDNASVIKKVTLPESTLHMRHNSIAYHKCREECAGGAARVAHEFGKGELE
jgi:hypothetical protein